jgi:hypothetical protein
MALAILKRVFVPGFLSLLLIVVCQPLCRSEEPLSPSDRLRTTENRPLALVIPDKPIGTAEVHPLRPVIDFAEAGCLHMRESIRDYVCVLVKHERVDGQLLEPQRVALKVRHERMDEDRVATPFSVYMQYTSPAKFKGREVLYVAGQNDGKLVARKGGTFLPYITAALDPNCNMAMTGNRYPITEVGIENLIRKLIEIGQEDLKHGECMVNYHREVKLADRPCTCIEVLHPVRREHFRFYRAEILVDEELKVPVHFAGYEWPESEGGDPRLVEAYSYVDMKLNVGLTDEDFQTTNPQYRFSKQWIRPSEEP